MAHFLEKQGFKQQALAVSTDLDHKLVGDCGCGESVMIVLPFRFELAMQLKDLRAAYELASKSEVSCLAKQCHLAHLCSVVLVWSE